MAMFKFKTTGPRTGKDVVLLDKYVFKDGEMIVTGKVAKAIKPVLCDFYKCTVEKIQHDSDVHDAIEDDEDETVLES